MAHEIEVGHDGLYSICVFNAADCSDDEITEIFGKYGAIARLNRSSNITFVRYQTLEEATNCYQDMQGNARFNVKPGRRKVASNTNGRTKGSRFGDMNHNDNPRGRKDTGGSGDFGRTKSVENARRPPPKLIPFPYTVSPEGGAAQPKQTAKIVVVGNLPPKMGQNNVYELCSKCQAPPLHVAIRTLKRPPYPSISYALVYVRNDKDATNIMSSLNNLKLNGHKLVVSSAEKLSEEGRGLLSAK